MGLLDFMGSSFDDPKTAATLTLAQGLLGGLGTQNGRQSGLMGLAMGLQGYNREMSYAKKEEEARKQREMQQQMQALQLQALQQQQAERAAAAARKTKDDGILAESFRPLAGPNPDGQAGVAPRFDLQGMIGRGLSMDSVPEALKLQSVLNPARKLTAYKPGDQVRDEAGNVAFSVPEAPEKKPEALRALAAVYGEGSPQYAQAARQYAQKLTTHQPGTTVNVGAEKAFSTELAKLDAKQLDTMRDGAEKAQSALGLVRNLRAADEQGAYSGGLADQKLAAANLINGLTGATPKGLVGSQLYNAEASKLVLESVKMLGQNPSNADVVFIQKTVPQLSTSPQARKEMVDFIESKAQRTIGLYQSADSYARKNSGLGGFQLIPDQNQPEAARPVPGSPVPVKRWNPTTKKFEGG